MSKLVKIFWTITSYAPLLFVCGIALFIDSLTSKQITDHVWIGCVVLGVGLLCIPFCLVIIILAKKNITQSKLKICSAAPGDNNSLSSMIAYLLPVVTLSIAEVNIWVLLAMVVIIVLMLLWTKAIFVNPLLYFFGYRYFEIQAESGMTYTLLSKQKRFNPKQEKTVIEIFDEIYLEV